MNCGQSGNAEAATTSTAPAEGDTRKSSNSSIKNTTALGRVRDEQVKVSMKGQVGSTGRSASVWRAHPSGTLQGTFQKQSRCRPGLSRCIFAVAVRSRLIAECMRGIGIGPNLDAFLVL